MLTDNNRNKKSAYFPAALTLADLNNQSMSEESEMDLSQSKLNRLGIDMSSLHEPDSSDKKDDLSDLKTGLQQFNQSIQGYSRKFNDSNNNVDLSQHMEHFKQKIQDLQMELGSEAPNSDPYKISIHSLRKQFGDSTQPHGLQSSENVSQPKFQSSGPTSRFPQPNTSFSSGGLSYQPPQLNSTNIRADPTGNLNEQLEYRRLKYYDSFLPTEHKLLNNPLKFLKYKVQQQDRYSLEHCLDCLIN